MASTILTAIYPNSATPAVPSHAAGENLAHSNGAMDAQICRRYHLIVGAEVDMPTLTINKLTHVYPNGVKTLGAISLEVPQD
jgi:hypothetical protein